MPPREIYLVSDLHWGGDGQLQVCEYAPEFIAWLKSLEGKDKSTELVILGDTFGLWESTAIRGPAALEEIIRHHREIFEQLAITGKAITITLMAGNHDYDLVCDPRYAELLAPYHIQFDGSLALTREIAGKKIWIEHGQQSDIFNRSDDYGNRYALPPGYFITETVVGGASRHSEFGRGSWLKDIRSVGTMQIPDWLISNYFYREMSPPLRWVLLPFLLLTGLSGLVLIGALLDFLGVTHTNIVLHNPLMTFSGPVGDLVRVVLWINAVVLAFVVLLGIPLFFVLRDARRTLQRFQLLGPDGIDPDVDSVAPYLEGARKVFTEHPDLSVFVFGHTHAAFLREGEDGRVILNTGTWLKLLHRTPVRLGFLPAVYIPTFRLSFFRIREEQGEAVIDYGEAPKEPREELTFLERVLLFGRSAPPTVPIPSRTVVRGGASHEGLDSRAQRPDPRRPKGR